MMNKWFRPLACAALGIIALSARADTVPADPTPAPVPAPAPQSEKAMEPPAVSEAGNILSRTFDTYAKAKSYQGTWDYQMQRGKITHHMIMEIRTRGENHLYFRLAPKPGEKVGPSEDPLPVMLVVLDGKNGWFENTNEGVYFKVDLPKSARVTPLMFFPQIPAVGDVTLSADSKPEDKPYYVLLTRTMDGGSSRMEIDRVSMHIHRITAENVVALAPVNSSITMTKEVFDGDVANSMFVYKPGKGLKEMPAPPGAAALFGPADK